MRYAEIVTETPQAIPGDWSEGDAFIADMSLTVYRTTWKKVGSLTAQGMDYDIAICITRPTSYLVGREDPSKIPNGKFIVIAVLDLSTIRTNPYGYRNLASVDQVVVRDNIRGFQIGTQLYRFVVKSGIILLSDIWT